MAESQSLVQGAQRALTQSVSAFMSNTDFLSADTLTPYWGFVAALGLMYIIYETKMDASAMFPRVLKWAMYACISGAIMGIPVMYGPFTNAFDSVAIEAPSSCSIPIITSSGISSKQVAITARQFSDYKAKGNNKNLIIDFIAWGSYSMDSIGDAYFCPAAGVVAVETMGALWINVAFAFKAAVFCGHYEPSSDGKQSPSPNDQSMEKYNDCINIVKDPSVVGMVATDKQIREKVDKEESCNPYSPACQAQTVIRSTLGVLTIGLSVVAALLALGWLGYGMGAAMLGMLISIVLSVMINFLTVISFALVQTISIIFFICISPFMMIDHLRPQVMSAIKVPLSSCLFGLAAGIIIYVGAIAVTAVSFAMDTWAKDGGGNTTVFKLVIVAFFGTIMATVILALQSFSMVKVPKLANDLVNLSLTSVVGLGGEILSMAKNVFAGAAGGAAVIGGIGAVAGVIGKSGLAQNFMPKFGGFRGPSGGGGGIPSSNFSTAGATASAPSSNFGSNVGNSSEPQEVKVANPVKTTSSESSNGDLVNNSIEQTEDAPAVKTRREAAVNEQRVALDTFGDSADSDPAPASPEQSPTTSPSADPSVVTPDDTASPVQATPSAAPAALVTPTISGGAAQMAAAAGTVVQAAKPKAPTPAQQKAQLTEERKEKASQRNIENAHRSAVEFHKDPKAYLDSVYSDKDPKNNLDAGNKMKADVKKNIRDLVSGTVATAWQGGISDAQGIGSEAALTSFNQGISSSGKSMHDAIKPSAEARKKYDEFIRNEKDAVTASMILRGDGDESDYGVDEATGFAETKLYERYLGPKLGKFKQELKDANKKIRKEQGRGAKLMTTKDLLFKDEYRDQLMANAGAHIKSSRATKIYVAAANEAALTGQRIQFAEAVSEADVKDGMSALENVYKIGFLSQSKYDEAVDGLKMKLESNLPTNEET